MLLSTTEHLTPWFTQVRNLDDDTALIYTQVHTWCTQISHLSQNTISFVSSLSGWKYNIHSQTNIYLSRNPIPSLTIMYVTKLLLFAVFELCFSSKTEDSKYDLHIGIRRKQRFHHIQYQVLRQSWSSSSCSQNTTNKSYVQEYLFFDIIALVPYTTKGRLHESKIAISLVIVYCCLRSLSNNF